MSSSKPPAQAAWLLEHLAIGRNRDAVAGDLLEQFTRRPSSAWYWRQVLAAVALDLWKERYILWIAIGFEVLWRALPLRFYTRLFGIVETSGVFLGLPWPLSVASRVGHEGVTNGLPLLAALCAYLVMTRRFSLRRLIRGFGVGLLALPLLGAWNIAFLVAMRGTRNWWVLQVVYAVVSLPLIVAMLLSMWAAALPERARRLTGLEGEKA
jgi:hypothetical protein